jgi:NAD(P)H-dependent flavin oxidoreductase YrpB (nitropropane dioxygenase family)
MRELQIGNLVVKLPIIQGGMGVGVSLSGLAVAVANEGSVGVISSAGLGLLYRSHSHDFLEASIFGLKQEIAKAREKTKGIIGVNVMVAMSNFADMVRTSIQEKVDILFTGAGLPLDLPSYRKDPNGTKLVPIVSSARAAHLICQKWKSTYDCFPDAIVVEGPKAGGHLGFKADNIFDEHYCLENLVKEVCEVVRPIEAEHGVKIPVIAAGGIYTGEDIYKIMQHGADAVQMGTRFVTSDECDAAVEFKEAYIKSEEKDIEIIKSPVGMPGRAILNNFLEKVKQGKKIPINCPFKCIKTCDISSSPYCIITALFNAFKGNLAGGYAFCGSNAFRATKIQPIKEIFSELKQEFRVAAKEGK